MGGVQAVCFVVPGCHVENQDLQNINGLEAAQDAQKALKNLDTKNLSVSIFIESTCPVCDRYLGAVEKLQKRYPTLSIRVFQLDNNQEAFIAKVGSRGLRGRILSPSEVAKVQQQGIRSWPVTWVDHLPTKKRETILGNRTLNQVETRLLAMTYAARQPRSQRRRSKHETVEDFLCGYGRPFDYFFGSQFRS